MLTGIARFALQVCLHGLLKNKTLSAFNHNPTVTVQDELISRACASSIIAAAIISKKAERLI